MSRADLFQKIMHMSHLCSKCIPLARITEMPALLRITQTINHGNGERWLSQCDILIKFNCTYFT